MELIQFNKKVPSTGTTGYAAMFSFFVLIVLCSFTRFPHRMVALNAGKEVFESRCMKCHGADGTKGKWGAKNLQVSKLSDSNLRNIITSGKGIMPAWGKRLTDEEIKWVIDYVKELRR